MKHIQMEKWQNGGGVTLRIKHQYDPAGKPPVIISLDFADVDNLLRLLNEYKDHPSPFCGPECQTHGYVSRYKPCSCGDVGVCDDRCPHLPRPCRESCRCPCPDEGRLPEVGKTGVERHATGGG